MYDMLEMAYQVLLKAQIWYFWTIFFSFIFFWKNIAVYWKSLKFIFIWLQRTFPVLQSDVDQVVKEWLTQRQLEQGWATFVLLYIVSSRISFAIIKLSSAKNKTDINWSIPSFLTTHNSIGFQVCLYRSHLL